MNKNLKTISTFLFLIPILLGCSNNVSKYGKKASWEDLYVFFHNRLFRFNVLHDGWYEYNCTFKNKEHVVTTKMFFEYNYAIEGNFIYTCLINKTGTRIDVTSSKDSWVMKTTYKDGTVAKQHGDAVSSWKPDGLFFQFSYRSNSIPEAYVEGNPVYFVNNSNKYLCKIKYDQTFTNIIEGVETYYTTSYAENAFIKREIKSCDPKDIEIVIDSDSEYSSKKLELDYT